MRKVITSFGFGPGYDDMVALTRSSLERYAQVHGYETFFPEHEWFLGTNRPQSWWKLELFQRLFVSGVDKIFWLDCDAVIRRFDKDILEDMEEGSQMGIVLHHSKPHGEIPNCGIWVLDKSALPTIWKATIMDKFNSSKHVWEQAAIASLIGYDHDTYPMLRPETFLLPWTELPYTWNVAVYDYLGGLPKDARIFHAAGIRPLDERIATIKEWAK